MTKIGRRADLYGSMDAAQAPYLNRALPLLPEYPWEMPFRSEGLNSIDGSMRLPRTLRDCIHNFEDAMRFWADVNDAPLTCRSTNSASNPTKPRTPTPSDAARVRHVLTDIQYTLVMISFPGDDPDERFFELCRISLIIYSLTILNERPTTTAVGQQLLGAFHQALVALTNLPHDHTDETPGLSWPLGLPVGFYLWAIYLATSVTNSPACHSRIWLMELFLKLAGASNIKDWDGLKTSLSCYLWVPEIHDATSCWFWDFVTRTQLE